MSQQTRLFVSNIPITLSEPDLLSAFTNYGEVTNIDLKTKTEGDADLKKFAFISIIASNYEVESCIKHFSNEVFHGNKLYVTRARESFLERLQRERDQAQRKVTFKETNNEDLPKQNPVINLSEKLNPRKRHFENKTEATYEKYNNAKIFKTQKHKENHSDSLFNESTEQKKEFTPIANQKKHISDKKRLESMQKKRNEFKEKQKIIKTGLVGIDKAHNKKIKFSDDEALEPVTPDSDKATRPDKHNILFEDDNASDDDVNFEIKEQYEGTKGQKVLDLQSRYKSDKRFVLDERFIDKESDEENYNENNGREEETMLAQEDEKSKQLSILQDVLGVQIKKYTEPPKDSKKNKSKLGMLRFDPNHPDHAKFIIPVEQKQDATKKSKKKKAKEIEDAVKQQPEVEIQKVEVSKEQFYKVSETLKETIAKPTTFSLRSLFAKNHEDDEEENTPDQDINYIPLEPSKGTKIKNPLDPGDKNPFQYDSSDSDDEDDKKNTEDKLQETSQPKAVWKENLFFTESDDRLKEGLIFFNNFKNDGTKERRELKYLMKKRINNAERKNQMFQKKIGGRKKTMKKRFRKKR